MPCKATRIYEEFIGNEAPREVNIWCISLCRFHCYCGCLNSHPAYFQVNIDYETRDMTQANLNSPTTSCFDMAQYRIYILMEKDCYPRFLRSASYRNLVNQLMAKSAKARSKKAPTTWTPCEEDKPKWNKADSGEVVLQKMEAQTRKEQSGS